MTTVSPYQNAYNESIEPGNVITVTTPVGGTAFVSRKGVLRGQTDTNVPANSTVTFGPYQQHCRLSITANLQPCEVMESTSDVTLVYLDGDGKVKANGSEVASSSATAARLKNIATRCFPPLTRQSGLATLNSRSIHTSRGISVYPEVNLPNFYMVNGSEVANGAGQVDCYIEYPLGTPPVRSLLNTAAGGLVAFQPGINKLVVPVVMPDGAEFAVCVFQNMGASGTIYVQTGGGSASSYCTHPEDRMDFSSTNNAGNPLSIGAANGTVYFPIAIKATSTRQSVALFGDSRGAGGDASVTDRSADLGVPAVIIGKKFAYTNWAQAATLQTQWNAGSHTFLNQLLAEGTYDTAYNDLGVNDAGNGADGATIAARRATWAAILKAQYSSLRVVGGTIYPYVGSSDVFVTKANQVVGAVNNVRVIDANVRIRAGITGEDAVFDGARYLDPYAEYVYPVSLNQTLAAVTPVTLTGGISGTTLTVTAVTGTITVDMPLYNAGGLLAASTLIKRQLSGTTGGVGTYEVSRPHSGFPYKAAVAAGTAMSSAGAITQDGLHLQQLGQELIVRAGGPALLAVV